jgi:hypothetical protein
MMPWIFDAVDYAALSTWPRNAPADSRSYDGISHFMFRRFLEWNYRQPLVSAPGFPGDSFVSDSEGYHIHAYGAHYHQFDISLDSAWVRLRKKDDLDEWAYAAFYIGDQPSGRTLLPVSRFTQAAVPSSNGWKNEDFDEIHIPYHADFDKAVVIVTAFSGEFDPTTVSETGHYQLHRQRGIFTLPDEHRFWLRPPIPWPYGPFPWVYGKAPLPPGVRPPPWYFSGYPGYYRYGSANRPEYNTPAGIGDHGVSDDSTFGSDHGSRYAWPFQQSWGGNAYRHHEMRSWPGYVPSWGQRNRALNYYQQ